MTQNLSLGISDEEVGINRLIQSIADSVMCSEVWNIERYCAENSSSLVLAVLFQMDIPLLLVTAVYSYQGGRSSGLQLHAQS